jgi:hypothetical protein
MFGEIDGEEKFSHRPHYFTSRASHHDFLLQAKNNTREQKDMDSRGIEPRTTPMLREYYTTKPQALLLKIGGRVSA